MRVTRHCKVAILHYTAPPVIGGVETVIQAHARAFVEAGRPVTVVAGRGDPAAFYADVAFVRISEMDSQRSDVLELSSVLERGVLPPGFEDAVAALVERMRPIAAGFEHLVVHNVFTKHFNLPLTAALHRLLDEGVIRNCIAWCHDFTWTSPRSRSKVHPGHPWDLLRTCRPDVTYVVVSKRRQRTLAELFDCPPKRIRVVYNGVNPQELLGLSVEGWALVTRLGLLESDLVLLMPVRVTRAKNIEYALRVVAAMKGRGLRSRLVVTGPPDPHDAHSMAYFRSLQDLRRQLGVEAEARFVFESGPDPDQPLSIDARMVGDLFRVSDVMFMPSHREGFGMPVLEAGLVGMPVVCTDVPAAEEIGGVDVVRFDPDEEPASVAGRIAHWAQGRSIHRLRRRVRQAYTWRAIFERDIRPLLGTEESLL